MNRSLRIILLSIALLLTFSLFTYSAASPSGLFRALFIDVGEGDSALIQDPQGFNILIDGGRYTGPTVVANLRQHGVDHIDVMIASHADADHIGGLVTVLNQPDLPVYAVYYNGYPGDTLTWAAFATAVANEGVVLTALQFPQEYTWGETRVHVLNPAAGLDDPETNQASIVLLLKNGAVDYLFTGDIDSTIEATVVARGTPVAAEILKVAHHGSDTSSSEAFLNAVQPAEAVISVGNNSYGHPSSETIERLLAVGATIWRTDLGGNVLVSSDGLSYTVRYEYYYTVLPLLYQRAALP